MIFKKKYDDFLILFVLFWASIITVLRAIRWPNDWAEAIWLISYNFGFLKRGLPGTFFLPFANENAELSIKIVSSSLLGLFCILLLWVCMQIIKNSKTSIESILSALLFLTSAYMVKSAHLIGYFDNILIIITIISCVLVTKNKIVFSSFVISIGVLIHENILVVGFPSILFISILQHIRQENPSSAFHFFLTYFSKFKLLIFMPVFVFLCVLFYQTIFLDTEELRSQLIAHLSQFEFIEDDRDIHAAIGITHSFFDYLFEQAPHFFERIINPIYIFQMGLPISILIFFGFRKLQLIGSRWPIFFIFVVITLLPLSLHLIAWDTSRIWTFPFVVVLLNIWGITKTHTGIYTEKDHSLLFIILTLIVIIFQLFITTPLMDNVHELFSAPKNRLILYAPSLILLAVYIGKNYCLTKRSAN